MNPQSAIPNPQSAILLGVDGGGTSTRAALMNAEGEVIAQAEAGPSNYQAVGIEAARAAIDSAVEGAWRATGHERRSADAAFLGMAGVISESDRAIIAQIASELQLAPPDRIGIDHDLRTALAGALDGGEGIVLIVGTGSSCYGRRNDGSSWRAGGWGHLLDDLGSGYWLGRKGLIAVTRAHDGRGARTTLTESLLGALGIDDIEEIMHAVHNRLTRTDIAALAPLVLHAADEDDNAAFEIVRLGAEELARMVQAVAQNLGWISDNVECAMIGGITANDAYAAEIEATIGKRAPNVLIKPAVHPPVIGAAKIAAAFARSKF